MSSASPFGAARFPARLWNYTNFHCNLACGYCGSAAGMAVCDASPDFLIGDASLSLADAKRRSIERSLRLPEDAGTGPEAFACAI